MSALVDDARLAQLLDLLALREAGAFANWSIKVQEVRDLVTEVQRHRAKAAA